MLQQFPVQNPDTPARSVDGEALVITPQDSTLHTLNPTGTLIWDLSDGRKTLEDIVTELVARFEVSPADARADAIEFVTEAQRKGLLLLRDEPQS